MSEDFEEQLQALSMIDDLKRTNDALAKLRNDNSPASADVSRRELNGGKLKSDLKKTTAFVKKIRVITSEGLLQCIRDVQTLNLTLYISEIVSAVVETNFKATDVPNVIKLCNELHLRYADFSTPLLTGLKESLLSPPDDDSASDKRKRIQIRMIVELFQIGIFLEENFFSALLKDLTGKSGSNQVMDISGLVTFVKYGAEVLLGYAPRRLQTLAKASGKQVSELPSKQLSSRRLCTDLQMQFTATTDKLREDLVRAHRDMRFKEKRAEKDKLIHGSLSEQKQAELDLAKRLFEKLMSSLSSLADATGLDLLPELQEEAEEEDGVGGISLWDGGGGAGQDYGPWGDAETKAFYEELPDLLTMVPLSALGFTPDQATQMREAWKLAKERQTTGEGETEGDSNFDTTNTSGSATVGGSGAGEDGEGSAWVEDENEDKTSAEAEKESEPVTSNGTKLQVLLREKLPEASSKQKADEFSVAFCYLMSKKAPKHLVAALLRVPRTRYELIPTYARIAASLGRLFPEIVKPLLEGLHKEFIGIYKAKNQQHIENKIKNIRFIGELVKFGVAPPIMAFRVFQKFLSDFVHHNVELCACLLETCGRYLYLTPYTHDRLENILDAVIRLRRAKNLDYRQQTVIDEAYFAVKPPERTMRKKKEYTDIQLYVRHLLLSKMTVTNVDNIIRQLRKLPWNDLQENVEGVVVKSTMKLARAKYSNVPLATDCLSGLSKYHPNVIVRLVDSVIEELCRGLASPHKREQQRMISYVRLLSELFNYASISSSVVFDIMYLILSYGYETDTATASQTLESFALSTATPISLALMIESIFDRKPFDTRRPCEIDAPTDCFRVQLICEMLQACGMYFVRGLAKMKLDDFMLYFQKYLLCKPSLPSHVEFSVLDLFDNLEQFAHDALKKEANTKGGKGVIGKKKVVVSTEVCFKRFTSLDEVCVAVEDLERKQAENAKERRQLAVKHGVVPITEAEGEEDEDNDEEEDDDNDEDDGEGAKDGHGRREEEVKDDDQDKDNDEEGDEEEETLDDEGEISAVDAARLAAKRREVEEDEEFEKAFKSLMLESVESAKPAGASVVRAGMVDRMAIPAVLPRPKNIVTKASSAEPIVGLKNPRHADNDEAVDSESSDDDEQEEEKASAPKKTMAFKLLGRDTKGRVETRQLLIPEETKIAKKILQADETRRLEKEKLKGKVLMYEMQQSGVDNNPVQYLGGKDHFAGKGPNQRTIESSRWQQGSQETAPASSSGQCVPLVPPTSNTLNLSDFLAESSAAEARRYHTSAGRGTVGGNVSATVHGQGGGRGRGGNGGGRGYHSGGGRG